MRKLVILFVFIIAGLNLHAQTKNKTENIVFITLDGLRWQELFTGADPALIGNKDYVDNPENLKEKFWDDNPAKRRKMLMPFMWTVVVKEGSIYGNRNVGSQVNLTNGFWFSYPSYNEILTGIEADDAVTSNDKINNPNITILEFVNKQKGFEGKVAAFGSWDVFPYIINEERSGVPVNAGFEPVVENPTQKELFLNELQEQIPSPWSTVRLDAFTHNYAFEYLRNSKPRLLYIAYGETDDFGHDGEFDSYLNSAHRTDEFVADIWKWLQQENQYAGKTTLIIATDHGRGHTPLEQWKSHGTKYTDSDQTWFAIISPDVAPQGEVQQKGQYYNSQYAATIAHLFGLDYKNGKKKIGEKLELNYE